jgi:hypothetical protein
MNKSKNIKTICNVKIHDNVHIHAHLNEHESLQHVNEFALQQGHGHVHNDVKLMGMFMFVCMFKLIFISMYMQMYFYMRYLFMYHSTEAEKFGIQNMEYNGITQKLLPIPTEARKCGSKKFRQIPYQRNSVEPWPSVSLFLEAASNQFLNMSRTETLMFSTSATAFGNPLIRTLAAFSKFFTTVLAAFRNLQELLSLFIETVPK